MNEKTRVSVTMTPPYIEALDTLIDGGFYLNRGEAILEALRLFLINKKIAPFYNGPEGDEEEMLEAVRIFLKNEKIEPFYKPPKAE